MSQENRFRFRWEARQTASQEEAEILLYSEIVSYKWDKEDDSERTALEFDKLVKDAAQSGAKRLRLRVNSPGGSVPQAVAMKTILETCGIPEIAIDIEGMCASAATFLVCVPGAKVRIAEGSEFMIHNPSTWGWGTGNDFEKLAERMHNLEKEQYGWYAQRTGKSEEEIKAMMDETTWLTAQAAVENGFADEMIPTGSEEEGPSEDAVTLMNEMYQRVPEALQANKHSSHGENPSEDTPTREEKPMDKKELKEQYPELYKELTEEARQEGVLQERQRIADIDDLTGEGMEELAREAKEKGTSAEGFLRQVVQHQKQQKQQYLENRRRETGPAQDVSGGSTGDGEDKDKREMEAFLKEAKEMAAQARQEMGGGMF